MLTAFEQEYAVREAIFYKYNAKNKLFVIVFVIDWFTGFSEALGCDDDLFFQRQHHQPETRSDQYPQMFYHWLNGSF
jgi:hypothetical protein